MAEHQSSSTPLTSVTASVRPDRLATEPGSRPQVEIRPSSRRRKTATAFYETGRIVVLVPARLSASQQQELADRLVGKLLRRAPRSAASDDALGVRAASLGDRYLDGVRPRSVRWSPNQHRRWGSCTPSTGEIRISSRLQIVPEWVLDSVLVHELAHLLEASHSPRFRELAARYPRLGEADAYLLGYSLGMSAGPVPPLGGEPDGESDDCLVQPARPATTAALASQERFSL